MGIRRFGRLLKSARANWALAMLGLLGDQTCICPMDRHMEDRQTNEAVAPSLALSCLRLSWYMQTASRKGHSSSCPLVCPPINFFRDHLSLRLHTLPAIWFINKCRCTAVNLANPRLCFKVSISPPNNLSHSFTGR